VGTGSTGSAADTVTGAVSAAGCPAQAMTRAPCPSAPIASEIAPKIRSNRLGSPPEAIRLPLPPARHDMPPNRAAVLRVSCPHCGESRRPPRSSDRCPAARRCRGSPSRRARPSQAICPCQRPAGLPHGPCTGTPGPLPRAGPRRPLHRSAPRREPANDESDSWTPRVRIEMALLSHNAGGWTRPPRPAWWGS